MPGKDGFEVAAFVRSRPSWRRVPVVLLTGAFDAGGRGASGRGWRGGGAGEAVRAADGHCQGARPAGRRSPDRRARPAAGRRCGWPRRCRRATPQRESSADEYFDRLDRAFATLNAARARAPRFHGRPQPSRCEHGAEPDLARPRPTSQLRRRHDPTVRRPVARPRLSRSRPRRPGRYLRDAARRRAGRAAAFRPAARRRAPAMTSWWIASRVASSSSWATAPSATWPPTSSRAPPSASCAKRSSGSRRELTRLGLSARRWHQRPRGLPRQYPQLRLKSEALGREP